MIFSMFRIVVVYELFFNTNFQIPNFAVSQQYESYLMYLISLGFDDIAKNWNIC